MQSTSAPYDLVLIGAGLANGLLALRLAEKRPDLRFVVLESSQRLLAEKTWSFHETDVAASPWVVGLASSTWPGYAVSFPRFEREFTSRYHSIRSNDFHAMLSDRLGDRLKLGARARARDSRSFELDGETIEAGAVIDGTGGEQSKPFTCGFQKFLGLEIMTEAPHGLTRPILMDAQVKQKDGFRFLYVLPWSADRLLIEDTRYSSSPALDPSELELDALSYARSKGWIATSILRRESGVLSIPYESPLRAREPLAIGTRAGLFHPVTGYSLGIAARVADRIAALPDLGAESIAREVGLVKRELASPYRFFALLNRMLFLAAEPIERYRVLERFYSLPDPLISRFYAGDSTWRDRARILSGRPPVPFLEAVKCLSPFQARRVAIG